VEVAICILKGFDMQAVLDEDINHFQLRSQVCLVGSDEDQTKTVAARYGFGARGSTKLAENGTDVELGRMF
jgi:hypothetical protein